MWSSSSGLLVLLLVATGAAHPSIDPSPTCPARRGGAALTAATIFDGPVADKFELVPDETHDAGTSEVSTWAVAKAYAAGRKIYAQCRYAATDVVVPVNHAVKACRYTVGKHTQTLSCR